MITLSRQHMFLLNLISALAAFPFTSYANSENILLNSGFEDSGLVSLFSGWRDNSGWADVDVEYSRVKGKGDGGTAVRINSSSYRRGAVQFVQGDINVTKGQAYVISIWMRGKLSQPVTLLLRERGRPYRVLASRSFRIGGEWREYRFKGVPVTNSDNAYFMVRFKGDGELWLDDAALMVSSRPAKEFTAIEGNLIANSGFEVGMGRWGVLYREAGAPQLSSVIEYMNPQPVLDRHDKYEGKYAMRLDVPDGAMVTATSEYFRGVPGQEYMLRVRLRAEHRQKLRIGVGHGTFKQRRRQSTTVVVGTQWKSYDMQIALPQTAEDAYYVFIQSAESGQLWIDGVEFKQENSDEYNASADIEVGLTREGLPTVMEVNEVATLDMLVASHINGTATIRLSMYNYLGRREVVFTKSMHLSAGDRRHFEVDIPTEHTGYYRVLAEVLMGDSRKDADEFSVAVVPKSLPPYIESPFGGHVRFNSESLELAHQLGVSWVRLHPPRTTKWYSVEPKAGKYYFFDKAVLAAKRYGYHVLGSLAGVPRWASTAPPGITAHNNSGYTAYVPSDYESWREYVYRTVKHYRGVIDYWEVWNEPSSHTFLKMSDDGGLVERAEEYMKLLRIAYEAAKKANPDAKIVGGCSTTIPPADWFRLLFERGGYDYMDVLSVHMYQGDMPSGPLGIPTTESVQELNKLMKAQNPSQPPKSIWQTEVGIRKPGTMYETRLNPHITGSLSGAEGAQFIVKRYVDILAAGIDKWFYYSMFWSERPERNDYIGLFEWDGGARPSAAAYAVLTHFLHGKKFEAMVNTDDNTVIAKFSSDEQVVYIAWSTEGKRKITSPLSNNKIDYAIYDIMGHALENKEPANLSESPLYFIRNKK